MPCKDHTKAAGCCKDHKKAALICGSPRYLNGHQLALTERRFGALGGLAPLGTDFDRPIIQALQAKLCGQYPEHLLPCAAPLLAALAKNGSETRDSPNMVLDGSAVACLRRMPHLHFMSLELVNQP